MTKDEDKKNGGGPDPYLAPRDEIVGQGQEPLHDPVFLSEDHREEKMRPPYLLIALIVFALLGAFWKISVRKDATTGMSRAQRAKVIEQSRIEWEEERRQIREMQSGKQ